MNEQLKKFFTPIAVKRLEYGYQIEVVGRTYTIENNVLFTSILSQGEELLAAPMRVVANENGHEALWQDCQVFLMDDVSDESVTLCATATSEAFYVNTAMRIEFDGCVKVDFKIMPRGSSVKEIFFGGSKKMEYHMDSFWLEIPLKKEVSTLYHIFPKMDIVLDDGTVKKEDYLSTGDFVHEGTTHMGEQVGQFLLCNENVGLGCFFESKKGWQPSHDNYVECVNGEMEVVLRVRFLDSHPKAWRHVNPKRDRSHFCPLWFSIGLQTLPVKEYPKNPYSERNVHLDCFKKIDSDYETYLSSPFVYDDGKVSDEIVFDRLKRLGINTLYLHEKWNTLQNSPEITETSGERLRYIVEECHKRGIKVVPYFGYEMSSLHPLYNEMIDLVAEKNTDGNSICSWNRVPYQRDIRVCGGEYWNNYFVDGIDRLLSKYGFDGIYLDGTTVCFPEGCANEAHGCGYRDEVGNLHTTYPFWKKRKLMRALFETVESHGGIINAHTSAAYNLATLAFCHSIWDGEVAQFSLLKGEIDEMPEGFFRSNFSSRMFGVPMYFLCYLNEPVWTFEHALTFSLLVGVLPKTVDLDYPLEIMSKIWNVIDEFPIASSEWVPFWDNHVFDISDERIKCSYYCLTEADGSKKYLAVLGNTVRENVSAWVNIKGNASMKQFLPEEMEVANGSELTFSPFSYRFLMIDAYYQK